MGSIWKKILHQYGPHHPGQRGGWSPRTFESCVEQETPRSDQEIADEGDEEYSIVPMSATASDAFEGQVHEHEICQSVDDLSRVDGGIVVLFAPVDCRGHRTPVRLFDRGIGYRRKP